MTIREFCSNGLGTAAGLNQQEICFDRSNVREGADQFIVARYGVCQVGVATAALHCRTHQVETCALPGVLRMLDCRPPMPFIHLSRFMEAYLHQDWDLEHGTLKRAVEAFRSDTSVEGRSAVVAELTRALSETPPDSFDRLLDELGGDINPAPWGGAEGLLRRILGIVE